MTTSKTECIAGISIGWGGRRLFGSEATLFSDSRVRLSWGQPINLNGYSSPITSALPSQPGGFNAFQMDSNSLLVYNHVGQFTFERCEGRNRSSGLRRYPCPAVHLGVRNTP